ncbi:MAG TPA: hypothetical protein VHX43_04425 [Xanthobacteraceae bacterium]|jgi:hypothetical protein|nr:hypothetical protein [Xanthobacteraceae bacterium]
MATGRRVVEKVGAALLAAAAAWGVLCVPARAQSCDPQDFWNALQNAASSVSSPACDTTYADPVGDAALIALAAALGGVMAEDPGANVCGAISNVFNDLTNGQSDLGTLSSTLGNLGVASGALDTVQQLLSGAANPVAAAECACQWDQGVGALGGDVLACLQSAICGIQQDVGWGGCGCTPPTPVAANCTPPIEECTGYGANPSDPACANAIYGQNGVNPPPVITKSVAGGTMVISVTDGWDGHSQYCSPDTYCFCPAPMQVVAVPNYYQDGGNTNNGYVMYVCECPSGTKAAGTSGGLAEVCMCPDGRPAVPSQVSLLNPTGSICPPIVTCPTGQEMIGGKCVTPCSNPNEGMTMSGACCDPNQVTSCGQCCPPGTTPDPTNGTCIPKQVAQ